MEATAEASGAACSAEMPAAGADAVRAAEVGASEARASEARAAEARAAEARAAEGQWESRLITTIRQPAEKLGMAIKSVGNVVDTVSAGLAAERAGVRPGDKIVTVNGRRGPAYHEVIAAD